VSDRVRSAIVTGAVGAGIIVFLRVAMRVTLNQYLRRRAERGRPAEVAALRTRYTILSRLVLAILAVVVAWSVLEVFPTTRELGRSLLASGAVLTLFVAVALTGPLSNIGAGVLLGLTQPVRLGDRITVGDATGTAHEITLFHTILITDDGKRVFVPNAQLTTSIVTNRSIDEPSRTVSVRLPIKLGVPVDEARRALLAAVGDVGYADATVTVDDVTDSVAWLKMSVTVTTGSAPVAPELRERGVAALAREQLLPGT
jgi:small-conductance mechanosensitive channel